MDQLKLLDETSIEAVKEAIQDVRTLVLDSREIPRQLRRYLLALVREAEAAREDRQSDDAEALRSHAFELGGALYNLAATQTVAESKRAKFRNLAATIVTALGLAVRGHHVGDAVLES